MGRFIAMVWVLPLAAIVGCVERTMTIRSNPPGALVYLNDQEIGRTPVTRDFLWYGNYDIQLRKEGYHTVNTNQKVIAPWYQWIPFDFVSEVLPLHLKDQQSFSYDLRPASTQPADAQALIQEATGLRSQLQSSEFTRQPTTQPATPTPSKP